MEIKNIVSEETFLKLAEKKVRAEYCINDSTTFTSKINKKGNAVFRTEKGKEFVVSGLLSTKPNKYNGISPEFAEAILLSTFPSLKEKDYKFIFKAEAIDVKLLKENMFFAIFISSQNLILFLVYQTGSTFYQMGG